MWNTDTIWVDIAVVTVFFLLGHIFFRHFEERSPKWRKVLKYILTLGIVLAISIYAGRVYAFGLLGLALLPVIYIHAVLSLKKGLTVGRVNQRQGIPVLAGSSERDPAPYAI